MLNIMETTKLSELKLETIKVDGIEFVEALLYYKGQLIKLPHVYVSRCGKLYRKERVFGKRVFRAGYITPSLADMGVNRGRIEYIFGVKLNGKSIFPRLSRVIASTFIENDDPANKDTVNHKDENPLNNSLDNLEWMPLDKNQKYSTKKRAEAVTKALSKIVEIHIGDTSYLAKSISIGCKAMKELGATGVSNSSVTQNLKGKAKSAGKLNGVKIRWSIPENLDEAQTLLAGNDFIELT